MQGKRCGCLIDTGTPFEDSPVALCSSSAVQLALDRPEWTPEINSMWPMRFRVRLPWLRAPPFAWHMLPCMSEVNLACVGLACCGYSSTKHICLFGVQHFMAAHPWGKKSAADCPALPAWVHLARKLCRAVTPVVLACPAGDGAAAAAGGVPGAAPSGLQLIIWQQHSTCKPSGRSQTAGAAAPAPAPAVGHLPAYHSQSSLSDQQLGVSAGGLLQGQEERRHLTVLPGQ